MKIGLIHQEHLSLCVTLPNNRAAKYVKQKLLKLKGKVDQSNYIWKIHKPSLQLMKQQNRKSHHIEKLNNTINYQCLIDIYRTPHTTAEYTTFSSIHGKPTSKTAHILGRTTNLDKIERLEIT